MAKARWGIDMASCGLRLAYAFRPTAALPALFVLSVAVLGFSSPTAWAADTVFSFEPAPAAARLDRMGAAREAIRLKDWKKSVAELTLAIKDRPGNADAHNLLAYSYRKQATPDLPKAFEHYNIALKLNPNHKGANEYIGEAYLMDKKPAKAEEHLARLKTICGNTSCEEYRDLAKSIADYKAKNK